MTTGAEAFGGFNGLKKNGEKIKVLVVDDSSFAIKLMSNFINTIGCDVCGTANDGIQAIEKYKECKPDVVTMDITMPNMDGIQAVKEIKKVDASAKIIMLTSLGHEPMVKEAIQSGAIYFIVKPITIAKIISNFIPIVKKLNL